MVHSAYSKKNKVADGALLPLISSRFQSIRVRGFASAMGRYSPVSGRYSPSSGRVIEHFALYYSWFLVPELDAAAFTTRYYT
mmetsp:Transcript_6317/g.11596  ORF Transcript_6317/g.11596 Transcript_6317/m.11596 type:complete len:82 (+) Transcript_6317:370-615(+)